MNWETELNGMIVRWAEARGILPADMMTFMLKFIAQNLKGDIDEEDLRIFIHEFYRLCIACQSRR